MDTYIKYQTEEYISSLPVGTVFANAKELQIKIDDRFLMTLGTGNYVEFTTSCKAYPVKAIRAAL
jgi:hypothetical protein